MALTKVSNSMLVQPVNHNILINPSFTVFQRAGTTASGEWGVDHNYSTYGPDRWRFAGKSQVGGTDVKSSTEVDDATGINKLVVKHPRDATDPIKDHAYVWQNIEAVNLQGLYNKEMTLSFGYSDVGGSGIPKVRITSIDSSDTNKTIYEAAPTSLGNNRWTCTVTLSTADGTIPDPSELGMQVAIYANEGNNAPAEWSVWETKLEVGSVATPFIARPYGEELALCQRYYTYDNIGGFTWAPSDSLHTAASAKLLLSLKVQMRASPTIEVQFTNNDSCIDTGFSANERWVAAHYQSSYSGQYCSGYWAYKLDAEL